MAKEKVKKPIYKRWWFILLVIIAAVCAFSAIKSNLGEKFEWSEMILSDQLPSPDGNRGKVTIDEEYRLSVDVYKMSKGDYKNYVKACIEYGYTIEKDETSSYYIAYNEAGYKLWVSYYESTKKMDISLDAPEEYNQIEWPTSGPGSLLPIPSSNIGKIVTNSSDKFTVLLGNMDRDDYVTYVAACEEAGFVLDFNKGEKLYEAFNEDGYKVSVNYMGYNNFRINIYIPEEISKEDVVVQEESSEVKESSEIEETSKVEESSEVAEQPKDDGLVDGMRPEFKKAMDSYEEFYKHYCNVLTKFAENPTDLTILAEYTKLMGEVADMTAAFEAWDENEMNTAEALYYIEVNGRVSQMLLEAGGSYY